MKGPRYVASVRWIGRVFGSLPIVGVLVAPFLLVRASVRFTVVDVASSAAFITVFALFGGLGMLLATRRPDNPIGPLFAFAGAFMTAGSLLGVYAEAGLPGRIWALWLSEWVPFLAIPLVPLILLLFPDGNLLSPRWRLVAWSAALSAPWLALGTAITPGDIADTGVVNPLGVEAIASEELLEEGGVGWLLLLLAFVGSAVSLVLRFRRSRGLQRQQMKGLALAALLLGGAWVAVSSLWTTLGEAVYLVLIPGFAALPVATALAILRYRLYDIDRIINRTLVYGAVTTMLGAAYAVIVTVAGTVLQGSDVVTAAATLTVAALFQPLRRRTQGFIDRHFYRRKYDAAKTVDSFSSRLRDEVDLETMRADLLSVVQETMQPRRVSLWLKF
jgi:hypothetical protein